MGNITRRQFLKGAAAAGSAIAIVSLLPGCRNPASVPSSPPVTVDVADATSITEVYEEVDLNIQQTAAVTLPLGSVLRVGNGVWSPFLMPAESANPMVVARAVSRETGEVRDLVMDMISDKGQRGVSLRSDWVIYDVRCSDNAFAWVELNMFTRDWKLYGQTMSDGNPTGEPALLWEADADYDPPAMCFSGNKLVWQVMPALSGSKTAEHSFAYLWEAGTKVSTAVVESPGRFASEPAASGSTVTLAPRVNAESGVYYGITAYSMKDDFGTIVDQLVLPTPIRPFRAVRIGDDFVFSVEATYQSGGLFQNMGTFIGPSEGPFIWLSREPSADVTGNGHGTFVIKSRASYFIVNVHRQNFQILSSAKDSVDYGDYPASVGRMGTFTTFATVKNVDTGQPQEVLFRAYKI